MACGILVPQPGIEPAPSAVKARSPNHWTQGIPHSGYFKKLTVMVGAWEAMERMDTLTPLQLAPQDGW